jgi:uncharacterized protein YecE (DUF72 family)
VIRVGPAGWSYPDWEGIVYPRRKPRGFHALRHLARYFDCVEINSSFYATPQARNAEHWVELVADRPAFRFSAKLQNVFTHEDLPGERLAREQAGAFLAGLEPLRRAGRLGALLVQFAHSFRRTAAGEERLAWIAATFGGLPLVLELRHRSWLAPEVLQHIRALGYALAWIDLPAGADRPGESAAGSRLAYLRLHGRNAAAWFDPRAGRDQKYDYLYSPDEVAELVRTTRRLASGADETYVITNNHFSGKAVANALEILAELAGAEVPGPAELLASFPALRGRVRPDPPGGARGGQEALFPS